MKKYVPFKAVLLLPILFSSHVSCAQWLNGLWTEKQADVWILGSNPAGDNGIDFNTGIPVLLPLGSLAVDEGSATISDAEGELQFYGGTNTLFNSSHQVMLNGSGLIGGAGSSTQFGVFVPKPGNPDIYYAFLVDNSSGVNPGLTYSEIDMTLDNGLGAVTANKNILLDADSKTEKITAVHHADGQGVWVITHRALSAEYVAFLVTADGVDTTPVVSEVGTFFTADGGPEGVGQLKASPDGSRLAAAILEGPNKGLDILDFDNATGIVSNDKHLGGYAFMPYGVEFSPNSKLLYLNDGIFGSGGFLYQYDLGFESAMEIQESQVNLASFFEIQWGGAAGMQLGPDGKLYSRSTANGGWNVIHFPNNQGEACGFESSAFIVNGGLNPPTFIQSYFASGILQEQLCDTQVSFSLLRIPDATSISWDFGDPASGEANISNEPNHTFSGPGTYTVTAQITSNGAIQVATTEVIITNGAPLFTTPADLFACVGEGEGTFDLTVQNPIILSQVEAPDFSISYFTSAENAQNNTGAITAVSSFTSLGQPIYARIDNIESGCFAIITFNLATVSGPAPANLPNIQACEGDTPGVAVFDLTVHESILLAGQAGIDISYYISNAAANSATDAIATPQAFSNTQSPQTVFIRLENSAGCYVVTELETVVLSAPMGAQLPELTSCRDTNGTAVFDLSSQEAILLEGQPAVTITYYNTEEDAHNETGEITTAAAFSTDLDSQTIYVRISNDNCHKIISFDIEALEIPVVEPHIEQTVCSPFNLLSIINGPDNWSFYTNADDAQAAENEIPNPGNYAFQDNSVVYIRAENNQGCTSFSELHLEAGGCEIPLGISPNGDARNDNWDLSSFEINKLSIFNRYGTQVYSRNNYSNQWAGQGSHDEELPSGTYYYSAELKDGNSKTGWVYVIRKQ